MINYQNLTGRGMGSLANYMKTGRVAPEGKRVSFEDVNEWEDMIRGAKAVARKPARLTGLGKMLFEKELGRIIG